jgi:hypothetical protein
MWRLPDDKTISRKYLINKVYIIYSEFLCGTFHEIGIVL